MVTHNSRKCCQVCAAMDATGDTSAVLDSTVWRTASRSFALCYLRLYGLIQAIHAQHHSIILLRQLRR